MVFDIIHVTRRDTHSRETFPKSNVVNGRGLLLLFLVALVGIDNTDWVDSTIY